MVAVIRRSGSVIVPLLFAAVLPICAHAQIFTSGGINFVSMVQGGHIAVYDGADWRPRFWTGVNLGTTMPGHFPGEFFQTKQQYSRWFQQMKDMNCRLLRVYTIMEPEFYQALLEFNQNQAEPLWLVQGIWSPEEELARISHQ